MSLSDTTPLHAASVISAIAPNKVAANGVPALFSGVTDEFSVGEDELSSLARNPTLTNIPVPMNNTKTPLWAWACLILSVCAMSSGGLFFALQDNATPPLLKAAWRLSLTAVLQVPGFMWDARALSSNFWMRLRTEWLAYLGIGAALGAHFGSWGWSINHTSMSHSLVLVWSTPIVLVLIMSLRAACGWTKPPAWGEIGGAVLGFSGVAVMLGATKGDSSSGGTGPSPTIIGDVAALIGGSIIIIYLEGGARLRQWVPTFIFALPVTAIAAIVLIFSSLVIEDTSFGGIGPTSIFGFLGSAHRAGLAIAAAAVSGILGHTAANAAVKYIPPLALTVAALWEPILGSLLGYAAGLEGKPSPLTLVSAIMILAAGLLVTMSARPTEIKTAAVIEIEAEAIEIEAKVTKLPGVNL
jgi:drug/metabolite transporter (DMT)-like permease